MSAVTAVWQTAAGPLALDRTLVMGIVNVTPDSFSDGGQYADPAAAVAHALALQADGADLIDVGGQSTRPGSKRISDEEEWARLAPVLAALRGRLTVPVSVDTFYPAVAERALDAGVAVVNDVSGSADPAMAALVARTGAGWVLTETAGAYGPDVAADVAARLDSLVRQAITYGVAEAQLCRDPGFGFGKDAAQNVALLRDLAAVAAAGGTPLLAGASRKRFVGALTGVEQPHKRDGGSLAVHLLCRQRGARILRTHNVALTVQALRVWQATEREA